MMKAIWNRIHAWLEANAPKGYGCLRPGASAEAIRAAERAIRLKLPADVKALYRIHDGQGIEPGLIGGEGWRLSSLREMVKDWRDWSRSNPECPYRVPVARGEMDDHVFLDLGPDSEKPGRLLLQRLDSAEPHPVVPSFRHWLEDFADNLDAGEFTSSEDDGCIMYADERDLD
jgi:cell wall assembly regulator SMI1